MEGEKEKKKNIDESGTILISVWKTVDWREGRSWGGKRVVQEVTAEGVVRGKGGWKRVRGTEARGERQVASMNHDTEADLEAQKLPV